MKKLILFLLTLSTLSCTITRKVKMELTFQKQTKTNIESYLKSKAVDHSLNDIATLNNVQTFAEYGSTDRLSVPEAYFFNSEGYRVKDNFKGTSCGQVINNAEKISAAPSENKEHISDWISKYSFLEDPGNITTAGYDAFVIVTWATFADAIKGSPNTTGFNWYKSLKQNKDVKIKVIFLNLDVQDNWQISDEQQKAIGLNITEAEK
jgi:hypothetical protein